MKPAYYSEFEPYAAAWLRNLIKAGHIPAGDVDERDIRAVQPDDLAGYGQRHFFAGIGGWALACRLAGFPDDADIVTGSPPCQPFSVAGRLAGTADDRHLWPEMARLVASLRPAAVAVENVANIVGLALDGMLADLAGCGYAARAFVVPACAVDAPHRRDRVWIAARRLADAACQLLDGGRDAGPGRRGEPADGGGGAVEHADSQRRGEARRAEGGSGAGGAGSPWDDAGWIAGRDGKARRVPQSGVRLLAHGVPARVGRLRAYGNSICPQVAAEILKAMRREGDA